MKIRQFLVILVSLLNLNGTTSQNDMEVLEREKRFLLYPDSITSDVGVLVAIAIPLDLPHRSVFVSYNFEANYPPPRTVADLIPFKFLNDDGGIGRNIHKDELLVGKESHNKTLAEEYGSDRQMKNDEEGNHITTEPQETSTPVPTDAKSPHKRDLRPIHELTGVIGDVFHIILTPSTSIREDLHPEYYKAEELGRSGNCSKYNKYCSQSILDYISHVMHII
uniref:Uncharacterized protein n=1 Tax=Phlebotomus papatasi TaxID=29031 RepID=A0A1B0D6N6_PHLPP